MKLFDGNGSQNTYPNIMQYYAEKYFGCKAIWRNNFRGIICGYNNDDLIMALEKDTRMRCLSRIELDVSHIGALSINDKYAYCQPHNIIGMDAKDQFSIGLEKEFFIGNYCMYNDIEYVINLICHNIDIIELQVENTNIFTDARTSLVYGVRPSYVLVDGILTAKHVLQNTNTINNGEILRLNSSKFYDK